MNFGGPFFVSALILVTTSAGMAEPSQKPALPVAEQAAKPAPVTNTVTPAVVKVPSTPVAPSEATQKLPTLNLAEVNAQISAMMASIFEASSQISTQIVALQAALRNAESKSSNICFLAGRLSASLQSMTQLEGATLSEDQIQVKPGFEAINRQIVELQKTQFAVADACGAATGTPATDILVNDLRESFEKTELLALIDQDVKILVTSIQAIKQNSKSPAPSSK